MIVLWGFYRRTNRICAIDLFRGALQRQGTVRARRIRYKTVCLVHKASGWSCEILRGRTFLSGAFYTRLFLSTRLGRIRGFSMLVTYAFTFFMYFRWPNNKRTFNCSAMSAVRVCAGELKERYGIQEDAPLSIALLAMRHRCHTSCIGWCQSLLFRQLDTACGCQASPLSVHIQLV